MSIPTTDYTRHEKGSSLKQDGYNKGVLKDENYKKFYESMQFERKTMDQLQGSDAEKVQKQLDDSIEFATKLMLMAAKNTGFPDEDGGGSKSKEMSDAAISIAQMSSTKALINSQMQSIEAQKNPKIDLMSLEGKMVDYNDDTKEFSGDSLKYNYKISHNEKSQSSFINLKFTISDSKGNTVKTIRQAGKTGEHKLEWDGKDNYDQTVPYGKYTISISAEGKKNIGEAYVSFPVQADTILSGIVENIKIKNGTAVGAVINGDLIAREQIIDIKNYNKPQDNNYITPDLIGKNIELDFSRAQAKDGTLEVYFNNHIKEPGILIVSLYDENNKFIKELISPQEVTEGVGKITFNARELGIEDRDYNVKTFVQGVNDPENIGKTELDYKEEAIVKGVNRLDSTITSVDGNIFSVHNIKSISGNYLSPIEQRRQEYIGSRITYRNDFFKYSENDMNQTALKFEKPKEEGEIIAYGQMNIYDCDTNEFIETVRENYEPYYYLDTDSKQKIDQYINDSFENIEYSTASAEQKIEINRYIEKEISNSNLTLQEQYQEDFSNGKASITFPAWDGNYQDNKKAEEGKLYRREFTPIYVKNNENNTTFTGQTDSELMMATVESVDEKEGGLFLNLIGGVQIPEEWVLFKPSL
jgi:flagellar hook assembly protein FlgD